MEDERRNLISANLIIGAIFASIASLSYLVLALEQTIAPYWLATGFGVFAVIHKGNRVLPGIALGMILTKLVSLKVGNLNDGYWEVWWVFPCFLTIKVLQIWLAGLLARLFFQRKKIIGRFREATKFFSVVALIPSAVGSTAGVILFSVVLHNTPPDFFLFWLSWTFGDLLGIVSFLPLAVIIWESNKSDQLRNGLRYGPPLLLSVLLSLLFCTILQNMEWRKYETQFQSSSERFARIFEGDINRQLDSLNMLANVVSYYGLPDADTFYGLAEDVFTVKKGLQAVNFSKLISEDERESVISQMRASGFSDFDIFNVDDRGKPIDLELADKYLPLLYVYPYEPNRAAQGMNLFGRKGLEDILERVTIQHEKMATSPIHLVQNVGDSMGVAVYAPIESYFFGEKQLIVINFVFLFDELFNRTWELLNDSSLSAHLVDITDPENPSFLATSQNSRLEEMAYNAPMNGLTMPFDYSTEIRFLNRIWHLHVEAPYGYPGILARLGSISVLAVSFLFISLLGGYQITLFHQGHIVEEEVRKRTQELQIAKEQAEEASRIKNEFLAMTNHELRTPLNGIIATSEMLLDGKLEEDQRHLASMIQSSGTILLDLINDVLDFARMEAGKLRLQETEFKAENLVEQWSSVFQIAADNKGLKLVFELNGQTGISLMGDVRRLNQILINFLGNAIKFTQEGQVIVRVNVREMNEDYCAFAFEVEDTGEGIGKKKMDRLFEAFEQEDEAITRRYEGTGLGLAICKQLSDAMNGTIEAESIKGKGTRIGFSVRLNRAQVEATESLDTMIQSFPARSEFPRMSILVVEDNPVNQKVMEMLLRRLNQSCIIARDGKTAIESLSLGPYDLILLDIHLPDIDGITVAANIREFDASWCWDVPIIALTANTTEEMRQRCKNARMQDFISKPIQISNLKSVLLKWSPLRN